MLKYLTFNRETPKLNRLHKSSKWIVLFTLRNTYYIWIAEAEDWREESVSSVVYALGLKRTFFLGNYCVPWLSLYLLLLWVSALNFLKGSWRLMLTFTTPPPNKNKFEGWVYLSLLFMKRENGRRGSNAPQKSLSVWVFLSLCATNTTVQLISIWLNNWQPQFTLFS